MIARRPLLSRRAPKLYDSAQRPLSIFRGGELKMPRSTRYTTRQRAAVLACLKERTGQYLGVQDVADAVKKLGVSVGLTTIYRNSMSSAAPAERSFICAAAKLNAWRRRFPATCSKTTASSSTSKVPLFKGFARTAGQRPMPQKPLQQTKPSKTADKQRGPPAARSSSVG